MAENILPNISQVLFIGHMCQRYADPQPCSFHFFTRSARGKEQESIFMLTKGQNFTRRYHNVQMLGQGGMGAVYCAIDIRLGVPVAIKENCVAEPEMRAAFKREAQFMANLRHPSLPICHDFLEVNGGQFLVMEFVEGDDLATAMVNARGPLPNTVIEELAWQLLDVIQYLHEEGVQHRDIKCRNIKFTNGRVYLLDFGISYGAAGEMETVGVGEGNGKYGSKRYSPPEQLNGESVGPSGDLYSMAATLYYAMTNVQPVGAEERLESLSCRREDPLEDVRIYNPAADERISRAVMAALSLNPENRPQSAADMRELMFPKAYAPTNDPSVFGFLTLRLLAEVFVLGVMACLLFLALQQPRTSDIGSPLALDTRLEVPGPVLTPNSTPEYTPTPIRTPVLTEEVTNSFRAEQAARLGDEAERARQSGKTKIALSKLMQARTLNDKDPYIHYLIGDIRLDAIVTSGQWSERMPEVLAAAQRVLELTHSPRSEKEYLARAWANVAMAYRNIARPDRRLLGLAIADANEVLKNYNADNVAALTIRASATYVRERAHIDKRMASGVLEDLGRVVKLTPNDPQAHANLARIHSELTDRAKRTSRAKHLELARR